MVDVADPQGPRADDLDDSQAADRLALLRARISEVRADITHSQAIARQISNAEGDAETASDAATATLALTYATRALAIAALADLELIAGYTLEGRPRHALTDWRYLGGAERA